MKLIMIKNDDGKGEVEKFTIHRDPATDTSKWFYVRTQDFIGNETDEYADTEALAENLKKQYGMI